MPPLHVIVSTHTDRHLGRVLAALGGSSRRPDSIVVSCDTDSEAVAAAVREGAAGIGVPVILVRRAHTGRSRSAQVRNNGVRELGSLGVPSNSVLVFLDGDCVPGAGSVLGHERLCGPRRLVVGFRHDLTEAQTAAFDDGAALAGQEPVAITNEQRLALARRERRYRRQAALRRLGLAKGHKPKLLSANFSVRLADYLAVNGFDERYEGYGQEDDDLGRRLYRDGCRPVVALTETVVYHLHHPTRAPGAWHESPNAALFDSGGPARCELGVDNPAPQPTVTVERWPAAPRRRVST